MNIRDVIINNIMYKIACQPGKEKTLDFWSKEFDRLVSSLAKATKGRSNEATLILLAALELLERSAKEYTKQSETINPKEIEEIENRLEKIADSLQRIE